MNRDLSKAIAEYKKRYSKKKTTEGAFWISDAAQIIDMTKSSGREFVYDLIFNSLEAGFIVGYRKAQRDIKKR